MSNSRAPFSDRPIYDAGAPWQPLSSWPAQWIHPLQAGPVPWVGYFRCRFRLESSLSASIHFTADERYELYLDDRFIGRGSERGDRANWFYETYPVELEAGPHTVVAKVWALGELAPWAQISVASGCFCCPEDPLLIPLLATGIAEWQFLPLPGYSFVSMDEPNGTAIGIGPAERADFHRIPEPRNENNEWQPVRPGAGGAGGFYLHTLREVPWLRPGSLANQSRGTWAGITPASLNGSGSEAEWGALINDGISIRIAACTRETVWLDLHDYVCGYPSLEWSGGDGSRIQIGWAEMLILPDGEKTRRLDPEGCFRCAHDEVIPDGATGRKWRSLWWRCGRFIEVRIETGPQPLVLEDFHIEETRAPLEPEGRWRTDNAKLNQLFQICARTLQMCSHETYMDCPYYEQLMYAGDARIQCLLTYLLSRDDTLPRKAIQMFDSSRVNPTGWTTDAYPSNEGKVIPPFSLWWIAMLYDYALWRGDKDFIRVHLPGARCILDKFHQLVDASGLLSSPLGWNFVDSHFPGGVPPGGHPGEKSALLQLQYLICLGYAIELERYAGEPELASLYRRRHADCRESLLLHYWNEKRCLIADDLKHGAFSEQAQYLGLLSEVLPIEKQASVWDALASAEDLLKVSAYFSHYAFAAFFSGRKPDLFWRGLARWYESIELGFKTTPETFGRTRSDCHAWSAHPLYHYYTGVLGIRPGSMGFATVRIEPMPGAELQEAEAVLPHATGEIEVSFCRADGGWRAEITLPECVEGELFWKGTKHCLAAGAHRMVLE